MTNVSNNGVVLHLGHIGSHDDIEVSSGSNEDVSSGKHVLQRLHFKAFHASLKGTDWVTLSDDNSGSAGLHGSSTSLANISKSADDDLLSGNHDISGSHKSIWERVTASVDVIELLLGDGVVHIDGLDEELSSLTHLLESQDSGGGLLADSVEDGDHLAPLVGSASLKLLSEDAEDLLHLEVVGGGWIWELLQLLKLDFSLDSLVHEQSGITTIIDQDVWTIGIWPCEHLQGAVPVLLQRLSLPGEDIGSLGFDNGGSSLVLSRVDVATGPSDLGAERGESLNEDGGLNGHVEGSTDAGTSEHLVVLVFLAEGHETWHLNLGKVQFFSSECGKGHILDFAFKGLHHDFVCFGVCK